MRVYNFITRLVYSIMYWYFMAARGPNIKKVRKYELEKHEEEYIEEKLREFDSSKAPGADQNDYWVFQGKVNRDV